ncbi:hypothetical protein POTOM_058807 [Populus tomentosa]|uniref:HXXXD-type acyl-transferase family protein n=1 Tax=Populus tomentosa TaxID=118781 RepID=A0A8X7XP43_POPTO|nr:hypothetical protein POTOM_058807 [Populus tomentosa]
MQRRDPVEVIKEALAKTLVFYFPFAGRLREGPKRKLFVECTGEGILFIEADGDVTLEQFGDALYPPFPCLKELIFDVPGSSGMINCPLLLIQVTRLKCGGIVFAIRLNHTMSDATGLNQFLSAMCEMVHGAQTPSIQPVWERQVLNARNPPQVTCLHHEYDQLVDTTDNVLLTKKTHRSCRTIALQPNPNDEMRIICVVNARNRFNPPLPRGYYGNCIAPSVAMATAGKISRNSLGFTLELVRKAKANVTEEYMRSVADLLVIKGRPWTEKGEDGVLVTLCLPTPAMERFAKELDSTFKEQSNGGGNAKSTLSSL